MALTKAKIAADLTKAVGLKQQYARGLVDCFFEELRTVLENGHPVKLSGFGNFDLRDKPGRPGRNPKTGEPVRISSRRVVTFKSGQKLKAKIGDIVTQSGDE